MNVNTQIARSGRHIKLSRLFDKVFFAAIQSGLLVDKAIIKACEAVEHVDAIETARKCVVNMQLNKEFGVDES